MKFNFNITVLYTKINEMDMGKTEKNVRLKKELGGKMILNYPSVQLERKTFTSSHIFYILVEFIQYHSKTPLKDLPGPL